MLTFIVLSSDGYSDCWDPFFTLFEKRFPKIENMEIILSTNTKKYSYKELNIKVLTHGEDVPWSKRLRLSLEKSKNNIVLPLSEDFFLKSKVNEDVFTKVLELISKEKEIDHIRLLNAPVYKTKKSRYEFLEEIEVATRKRFTFSPGLWKKEVLKNYINDHENPWIVEKMGDYRSKILKDGFYCISKDYVNKNGQLYDTFFSGVIYKGKCQSFVVPFLEREGFTDILKRGIMTKEEVKSIKRNAKKNLLLDILPIFRSFINISMLYLRQKIKGIKHQGKP